MGGSSIASLRTPWRSWRERRRSPPGGASAAATVGRVDLRADAEGIPHFMEVNPLAGLRPDHSDLPILCELAGMPYRELIAGIMRSALKRTRTAS